MYVVIETKTNSGEVTAVDLYQTKEKAILDIVDEAQADGFTKNNEEANILTKVMKVRGYYEDGEYRITLMEV